jgi:hypothetical protein
MYLNEDQELDEMKSNEHTLIKINGQTKCNLVNMP